MAELCGGPILEMELEFELIIHLLSLMPLSSNLTRVPILFVFVSEIRISSGETGSHRQPATPSFSFHFQALSVGESLKDNLGPRTYVRL